MSEMQKKNGGSSTSFWRYQARINTLNLKKLGFVSEFSQLVRFLEEQVGI